MKKFLIIVTLIFIGCGGGSSSGDTEVDGLIRIGNDGTPSDSSAYVAINIESSNIIIEKKTHLTDLEYNRDEASNYCKNLTLANRKDWLIPTPLQMQTIQFFLEKHPAYFGKEQSRGIYWSADRNESEYSEYHYEMIGEYTSKEHSQARLDYASDTILGDGRHSRFYIFCVSL